MKMYKKVTHNQEIKTVSKYRLNDDKDFGNSKKHHLKNYYKYPLEFKENYGNNKWTDGNIRETETMEKVQMEILEVKKNKI